MTDLKKIIDNEGNLKLFPYKGYDCMIKRNESFGYLCGYIELPKDHPLYGKSCDEINLICPNLPAHGGLTFAQIYNNTFLIGFDCGHYNDICPSYQNHLNLTYEKIEYRTMSYVENNIKEIIDKLIVDNLKISTK